MDEKRSPMNYNRWAEEYVIKRGTHTHTGELPDV
jgi:hypothetical protein